MARSRAHSAWWARRAVVIVAAGCLFVGATASIGVAKTSGPAIDPAFQGNVGQRRAAAVAAYGNGWVVAGDETNANDDAHAVIWLASKINGGWKRVFEESLGPDSSGNTINTNTHGVIVGSEGIVVAGSASAYKAGNLVNGPLPAVWFSPDASSWVSALLPLPAGATAGIAESVAAQSGHYVAVGTVSADGDVTGDGARPAAWYSNDGTTWRLAQGIVGSISEETKVWSVTAASPSSSPLFLAAGSSVSNNSLDAAVWTSDDGVTWTKVDNSTALGAANKFRDQEMFGVTAIGNGAGFMAVGDESNGSLTPSRGVVWRSTDGTQWTRTSATDTTFTSGDKTLSSMELRGVAVGSGYYVAVGQTQSAKANAFRARSWESTDGKKWTPLVTNDGTDKIDSDMIAVDTNGKNYEIVGVVRHDANNWNGTK